MTLEEKPDEPTKDEDTEVQRNTIIAGAAAIAVAIVGFLVWQHVAELGDRLSDLGGQVEDLGKRALTAEERAAEAEAKAGQAEREAAAAAQSAAVASERERESAEQARKSEAARKAAEERERQAAVQRKEAKLLAEASAAAREEAEKRELEAETERAAAQQAAEAARAETRRAEAEKEELERRLEEKLDRMQRALGRIADTRRTALGLVMTLDSSQIEFDFDKADLRPENREILSRITGVLLTFENYGIQVFGHTDDVGTVEYNQKLSERRAAAVREYLVTTGISPEVMTTMGMGKSSPLVEGTDPAARQRNRRVELAIVFSEGEFEAVAAEE